jgi:hypothetical protein
VRLGAVFAVLAVVAFAQISVSAQLKLPELPLDEPLDLEDLLNIDELLQGELPVAGDVGEVVDGVGGSVSSLLGGPTDVLGGKKTPAPGKKPAPRVVPKAPQIGSWSTEGLRPATDGSLTPTGVSSNRVPAPSYFAAVGDGFAGAARRAADLAGPVAAPMILALFAVGLLFVAARGPGRLVKVEEERKAFREQRTYRL